MVPTAISTKQYSVTLIGVVYKIWQDMSDLAFLCMMQSTCPVDCNVTNLRNMSQNSTMNHHITIFNIALRYQNFSNIVSKCLRSLALSIIIIDSCTVCMYTAE